MRCNMEDKPQCCGFPASDQGVRIKMAHSGHVEQPFASPDGEVRAQKGEILWLSLHSKQVAKPELEFGLFIYQFVVLGGGIKSMAPGMLGKLSLAELHGRSKQKRPTTGRGRKHRKVTWGQLPLTLKLEVNWGGFCDGCGYQPDTPVKRAPSWRNCSHQIGLWAGLWGISLIASRCRRASLTYPCIKLYIYGSWRQAW